MARLLITFEDDPHDDCGRLSVRVETAAFSGEGGVWTRPDDLSGFADTLSRYPIPADEPARLELGYGAPDSRTIARVVVGPKNARGALAVQVEINDEGDTGRGVRAGFETSYTGVESFVSQLRALLRGGPTEAQLIGVDD